MMVKESRWGGRWRARGRAGGKVGWVGEGGKGSQTSPVAPSCLARDLAMFLSREARA